MRVAFVHYNIGGRGGVTSVMRTNIKALLKLHKNVDITVAGAYKRDVIKDHKRVKYIDIPELDIREGRCEKYAKQDIYDYMRDGENIYERLDKELKGYAAVIIENPTIGVHPAATYAYYMFAKRNDELDRKTKVIFRIHDFAEDRRGNFIDLLKFTGYESLPYWHQIIFPKRENLGFVVINSKDIEKIKGHGIIEESKFFYLPNSVDDDLIEKDARTSKKLRQLLIRKYRQKKDIRFIYYPVRVVPRKNIEEAMFLTSLMDYYRSEDYCLLVSLEEHTAEGKRYAKMLKRFVKKHGLRVVIGLNDCVTATRVKEKGKLKTFGIGDAYNICDRVITTSLLEGFGMFFIESWFVGKSIIGRDLPNITSDFKNHGINLEHLYSSLFVDKKDFKDFAQKEKLKLVLKLRDKNFRAKVYEENKHQLEGMFSLFEKEHEKKEISENRKQVIKNFSSGHIAKELLKIIKKVR